MTSLSPFPYSLPVTGMNELNWSEQSRSLGPAYDIDMSTSVENLNLKCVSSIPKSDRRAFGAPTIL